MSGEGMTPNAGAAGPPAAPVPELRPSTLSGDHLITCRRAVADVQRSAGLGHLAERTLKGEADQLPLMQAAAIAVERVLKGMFE
jgi:hypothetical protein